VKYFNLEVFADSRLRRASVAAITEAIYDEQ